MDLWIRSQDKKKLIKVDEVKIETVVKGNIFIYSHATDLGTYKTKERALEVLDEIQEYINNKCQQYISKGDYYTSKYEYRVYQMPEE